MRTSAEMLINCIQLMGDHVSTVVFSCTANEARSYGMFAVEAYMVLSIYPSYQDVFC